MQDLCGLVATIAVILALSGVLPISFVILALAQSASEPDAGQSQDFVPARRP
jgi:hypothetical protein